jgi:metal-sulfur cluster biosynthetic enzyme
MLESEVLETLKQVIDAEVGINIVDLGLVYKVEIWADNLRVEMTMTTQSCPLGEHITNQAEGVLRAKFPEVKNVKIDLVWNPPWNASMMSPAAKERLGA